MYKVIAEKPHRVGIQYWRDKKCAKAYTRKLQNTFGNEEFRLKKVSKTLDKLSNDAIINVYFKKGE